MIDILFFWIIIIFVKFEFLIITLLFLDFIMCLQPIIILLGCLSFILIQFELYFTIFIVVDQSILNLHLQLLHFTKHLE